MNGTNLFKIALRALANNKLRAFLTMLGIIIGVASVIAMLAIGQGSKKSIQQQISEMGSNMIMIHPGAEMRGGVRQDPSAMQTLKLENYEKLSEECTYLSGISPNVSSSGQLVAGANNYPSSVSGVSMDYLTIRQLTVEQGEMFTENDIRTAAKVCVIGKTIVDNLFPDGSDPIGKVIRCNQIPFRVIGVLKSKGIALLYEKTVPLIGFKGNKIENYEEILFMGDEDDYIETDDEVDEYEEIEYIEVEDDEDGDYEEYEEIEYIEVEEDDNLDGYGDTDDEYEFDESVTADILLCKCIEA